MISAEDNTNVVALLARQIAGFPKVISVSSHVMPSLWVKRWNPLRKVFWLGLAVRTTYPLATARVAVSTSIAEEMSELLGLARESISVIHNPVTTPELAGSTEEEPAHPWLRQGDPPVVIGMGSLTPIKGFDVLLRAFADLRKTTGARLIVLGQGPQLGALIRLSQELGISEEVAFPGFVSSPQSYLREAGLFVLSSRSEGLPLVLVEAMACGCPVVSTDCSSGPVEILEGGRYGPLVPVDDTEALVEAMQARLAAPRDADGLRRGAERFRVDTILSEYRKILEF
jgi:glycosyltransferase involved in cell wall biosynthesis